MTSSSGEAIQSALPACLRNKNLYLSMFDNTRLIGIRIEPPSTDALMSDGPEETGNACILGSWDLCKDYGLPFGMSILVKDSKVYMIGVEHPECNRGLSSTSSLSGLVYEFANIPDGARPTFSNSSSVPQLPTEMAARIIVKHLGEIYVLYGGWQGCNICRDYEASNESDLEKNCFVVLSKDGKEWKSLTPPPFYGNKFRPTLKKHFSRDMLYLGAVGCKLCVSLESQMFCYDINKDEWKRTHLNWECREGSITLSSLSTEAAVGQLSYVVISTYFDHKHHRIYAALVDGDGNALRLQLVHEAKGSYDKMTSFKLIELESKKEKGDSSTFALVFNLSDAIFGLTVFRVSLLSFDKEVELVAKESILLEKKEFLKIKVLVNRRYETGKPCQRWSYRMNDAFFY